MHDLFLRLSESYSIFRACSPNQTVITEKFADGRVILRDDRPGLLVSSTSWTEDEDFNLLLGSLESKSRFSSFYMLFKIEDKMQGCILLHFR